MLRQDPTRRKRGEMNLKRRLADPPKRDVPARPSTSPALLSFEQTPPTEKPEHEQKGDAYQVPQLFEMLLSAAQSPGLIALAENNLRRARQDGDELYAAVFEGVLAANRTPPDLAEAVRCYHRAFDLAETSDAPPDGFLHSMAWSLFAEHSVNFEVTDLLKRARSGSDAEGFDARNAEWIRDTAREFQNLPTFAPAFEKFQAEHEDRIRRVRRLVFREGKLSKQWPLLLFPRATKSFAEQGFQHDIEEPKFGNYFFYSNGIGTVIDPDLTFLDEFCRLGGSLGEIRHIVFTSHPSRRIAPVIRQFCKLFEILHHELRNDGTPWFYVSRKIVQEIDNEFHDFVDRGTIQRIVGWEEGVAHIFDGGSLAIQNGAVGIQTIATTGRHHCAQVLLPTSDGVNSPSFLSSCSVSVFGGRTIDDFYRAATQARQCRPKLALFDFPEHFRLLENPLRDYLADIPWAPISDSLACDWANGRFVDAVKAFDSPEGIGWSEFRDLSFGTVPGSEELCYFSKDRADRFAEDGTDVMDFMQSARCRRRGLYFTS